MSEPEAISELKHFMDSQPTGPQWRTCAICLRSIEQHCYAAHMQHDHGYASLAIGAIISEQI